MATYATYRHIELDHIGSGKKRSPYGSRVLAPPGGKCSDIFGSSDEPQKMPTKSAELFRDDVGSSPLRSRQSPDTQHRLFGEKEAEVEKTSSEDVKDGATTPPLVAEENKENRKVDEENDSDEDSNAEVNGENDKNDENDRNPVTGGGEKPADEQPKRRVPPGGFSSKLW